MKITLTMNEETIVYPYFPEKRTSQITSRGVLTGTGVCRVSYNSKEYNEFSFENAEDFKLKFLPCVEKELLNFLGIKHDKTVS